MVRAVELPERLGISLVHHLGDVARCPDVTSDRTTLCFDHAYFIRDVRRIVGQSPSAYAAEVVAARRDPTVSG